MVRFLMIIFDGASEDVPNEDLTLIKDELSFSLSLSIINDKMTTVVTIIRVAKQKKNLLKDPIYFVRQR